MELKPELEVLATELEEWRITAFHLMQVRGWSHDRDNRLAHVVEEATELWAALRGKGNSSVEEEAGDLLICALAMIPAHVSLATVLGINRDKIARLMVAPPYAGEDQRA